jgi:hypothetical protein
MVGCEERAYAEARKAAREIMAGTSPVHKKWRTFSNTEALIPASQKRVREKDTGTSAWPSGETGRGTLHVHKGEVANLLGFWCVAVAALGALVLLDELLQLRTAQADDVLVSVERSPVVRHIHNQAQVSAT